MWIDPQKINTTAPPGPSSSVKHADELSRLNPSINDKVRMGQEAMARKRRAWADWVAIGEALQVGRAEVMRETHTNQPTGRRYEKTMAEWLVANGFKEIDKGVRCRPIGSLLRWFPGSPPAPRRWRGGSRRNRGAIGDAIVDGRWSSAAAWRREHQCAGKACRHLRRRTPIVIKEPADARFSSDDLSAAVSAASIADRPPVTT